MVVGWKQMADAPGQVRRTACATVNAKIYMGFGFTGTAALKDWYEYNHLIDLWTPRTQYPGITRWDSVLAPIGTKIYMGLSANNDNDWWRYDTVADSWLQRTDFGGTGRRGARAVGDGSAIYIFCGHDGSPKKDVWKYTEDTWVQQGDFPGAARSYALGVFTNGRIFFGLGWTGVAVEDWWEYNAATDAWTARAVFPSAISPGHGGAIAAIDNKIFVGTGWETSARRLWWVYDILTDSWTQLEDFPGGDRYNAVASAIGGKVYVGTGRNNLGVAQKDWWEYTPEP